MRALGPVALAALAALALAGVTVAGRADRGERDAVRVLGPTDPAATLEFSLVLRPRNPEALGHYLRALHDPASARYRRFITPARFGDRFGVSRNALSRVRRVLGEAGLEAGRAYPQRTQLRVRGPVAAVNRFLGTRLVDYADGSGRRWHAPLRPAVVPLPIAGSVELAAGLDSRHLMRPAAVPRGGLKPGDAATAYNLTPLKRQGLRGQRQTIAIVSFDSFHDEDVADYDRRVGIRGAPPVEHVPVGAGARPGAGQDEVNLDIDVIRGIAPRARILNYEAPNDGRGFGHIIERIVADGRADIVSISWGTCALRYDPALRRADARALEAAVARGLSIFVASGDAGAYDCQRFKPSDHRLSVDWPSASPDVISVGGTSLALREDSSYLRETGWEDVLSNGGGGGGLSSFDRRPPWQRGRGVENEHSNGMRQLPDVAAAADGDSGWYVYFGGRAHQIGGTSAAAPFWAGSMLLVRQLAQRERAGRLGSVGPLLYRLAERRNSPFHDVKRGGNRGYDAGPGWDYATGLGSPDVARLARQLVALVRKGG